MAMIMMDKTYSKSQKKLNHRTKIVRHEKQRWDLITIELNRAEINSLLLNCSTFAFFLSISLNQLTDFFVPKEEEEGLYRQGRAWKHKAELKGNQSNPFRLLHHIEDESSTKIRRNNFQMVPTKWSSPRKISCITWFLAGESNKHHLENDIEGTD